MSYVYIHSQQAGKKMHEDYPDKYEHDLFTVGFYLPSGRFEAESDHPTREAAAYRVHSLNGGAANDANAEERRNENDCKQAFIQPSVGPINT